MKFGRRRFLQGLAALAAAPLLKSVPVLGEQYSLLVPSERRLYVEAPAQPWKPELRRLIEIRLRNDSQHIGGYQLAQPSVGSVIGLTVGPYGTGRWVAGPGEQIILPNGLPRQHTTRGLEATLIGYDQHDRLILVGNGRTQLLEAPW